MPLYADEQVENAFRALAQGEARIGMAVRGADVMATSLLLLLPPLVLSTRASTIFSIRSFNASAMSFQSSSSSSSASFRFSPVAKAPGTPGASLLGSCSPAGVLGVTRPEPVSGYGSL